MPSKENISYNGLLQSNRLLYPDILRILAVFAVMMIHVSASGFYTNPVQSFTWQVVNFYECMVRWAVPVFVMVTGMFFLNLSKRDNFVKTISQEYF